MSHTYLHKEICSWKTPAALLDGHSLRELSNSSYIPGRQVYRPEDQVPPEINNDFSQAGCGPRAPLSLFNCGDELG